MSVTCAAICDAIVAHLEDAPGIARGQSYDELTEGMNTTPTIQCYLQASNTPYQFTFRQGVRLTEALFHLEAVAAQRSDLKADMKVLMQTIDAIQTELEKEREGPVFGVAGTQWVNWHGERVSYTYSGIDYMGWRWYLETKIY